MNFQGKKYCDRCLEVIKSEPCPHCGYKKNKYKPEFGILPVGTVLAGRYSVGKVLGKGGFGVTYKAFDTLMGRIVAIKEYYPNGLVHRDSGTKEVTVTDDKHTDSFEMGAGKFYEEAKTVSKFNGNPNIVGVYEFFYENNTVYYVMEYLDGKDLKQYLNDNGKKLSQEKALYLINTLTDALTITHSLNVLHRDISPDNIFVLESGEIKLIDFGAARQVLAEQSKSLSVILKQGFAPLEQYERRGKQGPWTYIYALGATIYFALTGSVMDDATERLEDDSIGEAAQYGVEEEFWSIIQKCVAVKPENRYQSIPELKQDINKLSIKAVPLVDTTNSEIGMTIAVQGAMGIGETVAVPSDDDIGETVAVSTNEDIGATVAASANEDIGETVAVTSNKDTNEAVALASTKSEHDDTSNAVPIFRTKKGIIAIAAALTVIVLVTGTVLALTNGRRDKSGRNNGGNSDIMEADRSSDNNDTDSALSGEGRTEETTADSVTTAANSETTAVDNTKVTEAPTEKKTEAPTEKKTEAPTEKKTEAPTEKKTEAPTKPPVESVKNKSYSITCPTGDRVFNGKYSGNWKNGKPNGYGVFVYSGSVSDDITEYRYMKGTWVNGKLEGAGKFVEAEAFNTYKPDWGEYWGKFNFAMIYVGNFTSGKANGKHVVYNASDGEMLGGGYKYNITFSKGTVTSDNFDTSNFNWDLKYKL